MPPGVNSVVPVSCQVMMIAGRQQQDRGADQQPEVEPPARARLLVAVVRDQRIGHQRQDLVEQEQREQVDAKAMPMVAASDSAKQT
jgi:hypothetical protein